MLYIWKGHTKQQALQALERLGLDTVRLSRLEAVQVKAILYKEIEKRYPHLKG